MSPGYAEALNNLGKVFYWEGRLDDAVVHYKKAIRLKSDYKNAQRNLAEALGKKNVPPQFIRKENGIFQRAR